jgi:transcriptional regulator with XRE-family HTH domain
MRNSPRPTDLTPIGLRLKLRRIQLQKGQQAVAARAGITVTHLSKIEHGRHTPGLVTLGKIARELDTSVWELVNDARETSSVTH